MHDAVEVQFFLKQSNLPLVAHLGATDFFKQNSSASGSRVSSRLQMRQKLTPPTLNNVAEWRKLITTRRLSWLDPREILRFYDNRDAALLSAEWEDVERCLEDVIASIALGFFQKLQRVGYDFENAVRNVQLHIFRGITEPESPLGIGVRNHFVIAVRNAAKTELEKAETYLARFGEDKADLSDDFSEVYKPQPFSADAFVAAQAIEDDILTHIDRINAISGDDLADLRRSAYLMRLHKFTFEEIAEILDRSERQVRRWFEELEAQAGIYPGQK